MSSRIESPFGGLGDRVARTRGDLPDPPRARGTPRHPRGLHLDVLNDEDGWVPGLLVAWEHDAAGHRRRRVVIVTPLAGRRTTLVTPDGMHGTAVTQGVFYEPGHN